MKRFHWIVTDLDGTLVDRDLAMVPRSRRALRHYLAAGGRVVIATGRSRDSASPYYAELGLTGPAILLNGALICDLSTGALLLDIRLTPQAWLGVRTFLKALPAACAGVVFVGDNAYRVSDSALIEAYAARDRLTVQQLPSWDELAEDQISKAMVLCADTATAADWLEQAGTLPVRAFVSEPTYVELLPCGADKGTALTWLAEQSGIPLDEVAAVGDNPNDIPMFAVAGLAAAAYDGHPEAKAAADIVVGRCADGAVADVVDLLNGLGAK